MFSSFGRRGNLTILKNFSPFLTAMYSKIPKLLISEQISEKYFSFYLIASGAGRKGRFPEIFLGCRISPPFLFWQLCIGIFQNGHFSEQCRKNIFIPSTGSFERGRNLTILRKYFFQSAFPSDCYVFGNAENPNLGNIFQKNILPIFLWTSACRNHGSF